MNSEALRRGIALIQQQLRRSDGDILHLQVQNKSERETLAGFADHFSSESTRRALSAHEVVAIELAKSLVAEFDADGLEIRADELSERLKRIGSALPLLAEASHESALGQVVVAVLAHFRNSPPPEEVEGVEHGLDYLGLLKTEGSSNGLHELAMDMIDAEANRFIDKLPWAECVALLAPLVGEGLDDLALDHDPEDWPRALYGLGQWQERIRREVMAEVTYKDRQA